MRSAQKPCRVQAELIVQVPGLCTSSSWMSLRQGCGSAQQDGNFRFMTVNESSNRCALELEMRGSSPGEKHSS